MNPGDTALAAGEPPGSVWPLNEGRGVNPGDTTGALAVCAVRQRSTKAGA